MNDDIGVGYTIQIGLNAFFLYNISFSSLQAISVVRLKIKSKNISNDGTKCAQATEFLLMKCRGVGYRMLAVRQRHSHSRSLVGDTQTKPHKQPWREKH